MNPIIELESNNWIEIELFTVYKKYVIRDNKKIDKNLNNIIRYDWDEVMGLKR